MSFVTGKFTHRSRVNDDSQWQSDSDEETTQPTVDNGSSSLSAPSANVDSDAVDSNQTSSGQAFSNKTSNINETSLENLTMSPSENTTTNARNISRENYLEKRLATKITQVGQEIQQYEEMIKNKGIESLSKYQLQDFDRKKELYTLIQEREKLKNFKIENEYNLPEFLVDRKRKHEALNHREKIVEEEVDVPERKRYDSQWEKEQVSRAQIIHSASSDPNSINLPGQDKYEYVFDEDQFVQFEEDDDINVLPGDADPESRSSVEINTLVDLQEVRRSLPVYGYREQFLEKVQQNQVLVVVGETGSGKTTQLPQYLHEAGYSKDGKTIGCTQPRRVAATSVAQRVSEEFGCKIGREVGYSIRFEDKTSEATKIKYLTDGILLREFLTDPELMNYGALMIDEAHERTVSTEIILSLLKDILKVRKDLKLIVASATINADKFSDFFDGAPVFKIPGRRFPVDIHYTKSPEANYIQAAITTIFQVHLTQKRGDILVFLTGQEEIETMEESLNEAVQQMDLKQNKLLVCSIYANLPPDQQQLIFEPTPPNARKVVLATNIAETSITIEGVAYVIDPGYVKENVFNPQTGMESLVVVPCSRASADQRSGRAGRVGPGKCFRLYTKWSFYNELQANPTPEILRVNLASVVLLLLSLGVTDLIGFDFMDPPSPETLIKLLELLYALGALNAKGSLTKIGRTMVEFPIDPMFAKCIISGFQYGVGEEVLSIVAILGESSNLFYRPKDKREAADRCKERFHETQGDHLTLLKIWTEWVDTEFSSQWCRDNYIQYKTMKRSREVREQLGRLCLKAGINSGVVKAPTDITLMIQKAITSGFFPNVARLSQMGDSYRTLKKNQTVYIHPSSSIFDVQPPAKLVVYHELVLTSKEFMRNCLIIDGKWLAEVAPHYYNEKELSVFKKK